MEPFPSDRIRNVALVGHQGAGKTTVAEALLHRSGAIARRGRVEDGTTACDWTPEEHDRGTTLTLSIAPVIWRSHKINLLDTPGYGEFDGEVSAALRVADLALFVIGGTDAAHTRTRVLWDRAAALGIPRMIFINKLDRDGTAFEEQVDRLGAALGAQLLPLELPLLEGPALAGLVDVLRERALQYHDGVPSEVPLPENVTAHEHEVHGQVVEGIVVGDDALLEGYLEGTEPPVEVLEATLARALIDGDLIPVLGGSALEEVGIDQLADAICAFGPSAARPGEVRSAGHEQEASNRQMAAPEPAVLAQVFKTIVDPYLGRISLLKVHGGTLHANDHLVNARTGHDERLHSLSILRGHDHEPVREASTGDLVAVAKLSDAATGDTLAQRGDPRVLPVAPCPEPVYALAVQATAHADENKLATALRRLCEEDASLHVRHDDETHQTLLEGAGETHLAVAIDRLRRRHGLDVHTEEVAIPYRETVTATATAEGRYKKQSGGHGQFGVVSLRIEPRPAGSGFEFLDEVVGGAIPRQFIAAVRTGVEEAMAEGGVLGHPVVDIAIACTDGRHHPVDSSEMSFKMAAKLAFHAAEAEASPVVLEPFSHLEVTAPASLQGDVLGDLATRRARVQGTSAVTADEICISATAPRAELRRYAVDLRALTAGQGTVSFTADGFEQVPASAAQSPAAKT